MRANEFVTEAIKLPTAPTAPDMPDLSMLANLLKDNPIAANLLKSNPDTTSSIDLMKLLQPDTASADSSSSTVKKSKSSAKGTTANTASIQDPNFNKKLTKVANALGIAEADLRAIIKTESNFDPKAEDPNNVSVGLIGFTERTARGLGTSKDEIRKMSAVDQLDLVYRFYKNAGVQPGMDRGTIYMLTFMPAFAKSPDDTVLGRKGGGTLILPSGKSSGLSMHKVWEQNPVFGKSKGKSQFTVGDVKNLVNSR